VFPEILSDKIFISLLIFSGESVLCVPPNQCEAVVATVLQTSDERILLLARGRSERTKTVHALVVRLFAGPAFVDRA
jgi:hypothetical protein